LEESLKRADARAGYYG